MIRDVTSRSTVESRRYDFPPLWTVPLLLLAGITAVVVVGASFGLLGLLVALAVVVWLQCKADAYVRARDGE